MSAPLRINYLARRNAGFTAEEWIGVWRSHWALAASLPESATVRRYIQCEVLLDPCAAPHHAVASSEYFSPEARAANRGAVGYHATMGADEERVFETRISECSFIGEHHVLAGSGTGPFKAVRFLRAVDFDAWAPVALSLSDELLGYAQNRAVEPERPEGWGLDVAGSEEFWFDNALSAIDFLESDLLREETTAAGLEVEHAVVTNEVILKDVR